MKKARRAEYAADAVRSWVLSEPMTALLALIQDVRPTAKPGADAMTWLHLNEELPAWLIELLERGIESAPPTVTGTLRILQRTLEIERQAAVDFNFRSQDGQTYRERSEAIVADFDDATRSEVVRLTNELGLVESETTRHLSYDKTLVLGGGWRSPLLRTRYAALLESQGIGLGDLSFLGSPRFLITADPPERDVTETYAPGATDEFDLMVAASQAEFSLTASSVTYLCGCASTAAICPRWQHDESYIPDDVPSQYTHERAVHLIDTDMRRRGSVISASTSRPPYRPDTSDTFELWARFADPRPGQRLLVVTTQVFVPFQRFDGLRRLYLPHDLDIDTVGFGAAWGDRPQTTEYLLQETLSAIRSARRLLVEAIEAITDNE